MPRKCRAATESGVQAGAVAPRNTKGVKRKAAASEAQTEGAGPASAGPVVAKRQRKAVAVAAETMTAAGGAKSWQEAKKPAKAQPASGADKREKGQKRKAGEGCDEEGGAAGPSVNGVVEPIKSGASQVGKDRTVKVTSWNLNGLKPHIESGSIPALVAAEDPDVLCLQETKASDKAVFSGLLPDRFCYYSMCASGGYAGTCIFTKEKAISVQYGIGDQKFDGEGRVITVELPTLYVVGTYIPNAGQGLVRLSYRMEWDVAFRSFLCALRAKKPVAWVGDLNVAHQEVDLAKPKGNNRTPGFTKEERQSFSDLLAAGFVDSFRKLHPDETGAFTFWSNRFPTNRPNNIGWRLDYAVVSEGLFPSVKSVTHHTAVMGSDHCPISVVIATKN